MARTSKDKRSSIERDRKIQKLTRMIKAKERELGLVERRLEKSKNQASKGEISKGEYRRQHIELGRERKAIRGAITRLERGRLSRERKLKERAADKEEREREREERRQRRAEEKERRRQKKAEQRAGKGADEEDED